MVNRLAPTRCLLCDDAVSDDMPRHLRTVHQVLTGERTRADVPVGPFPSPLPAKIIELRHEDDQLLFVS